MLHFYFSNKLIKNLCDRYNSNTNYELRNNHKSLRNSQDPDDIHCASSFTLEYDSKIKACMIYFTIVFVKAYPYYQKFYVDIGPHKLKYFCCSAFVESAAYSWILLGVRKFLFLTETISLDRLFIFICKQKHGGCCNYNKT